MRPFGPWSDEVREQLASSPVWQEGAQLALDVDLPPELIALLVRDEEMTVRCMTYDRHRNIEMTAAQALNLLRKAITGELS